MTISPETIKQDFPIFGRHPDLTYLDSAATALKLRSVIEKEREYAEEYSTNISRGLYPLAERATEEYEKTRDAVAEWIGASRNEIIFTKGTTESLNLLSYSLEAQVSAKDTLVVTGMDHHANFLPWQALAKRAGAHFRVLPVSESGEIREDELASLIDIRTKIVAFPYISNVLGSIAPVRDIVREIRARAPRAIIILDAAQAAPRMAIDVNALDADFIAFSAHKCFGPTGVGILWGKYDRLESLPPFQYGGDMVENATIKESTFKKPPHRFEAGTPNISGVIGFRPAVEFIEALGMEHIRDYEERLAKYAVEKLRENFPAIRILGPDNVQKRGSLISFALPGIHPHDIADFLGQEQICIRAGTHCAHPLHATLGIPATLRLSFSLYNTENDIDRAVLSIAQAQSVFSKR